jgi:hypothetical protein
MNIATSDNRAYPASVPRTYAQIPLRGNSDMLVTLYAIARTLEEIKS